MKLLALVPDHVLCHTSDYFMRVVLVLLLPALPAKGSFLPGPEGPGISTMLASQPCASNVCHRVVIT